MDKIKIVYQDRILRVTKSFAEKGYKYKIEITDGRFFRSWEENYSNDEEAIKGAKRKFGSLFDSKEVTQYDY